MARVGQTKRSEQPLRARRSAVEPVLPHDGSPTYEEIARRAYEIYLTRGGEPGHELEDWLQAERELREQRAKSHAA